MNLSIRRQVRLPSLALLLAAGAMLLLTSWAQAASNGGAVLVKDIRPGHSGAIRAPTEAEMSTPSSPTTVARST